MIFPGLAGAGTVNDKKAHQGPHADAGIGIACDGARAGGTADKMVVQETCHASTGGKQDWFPELPGFQPIFEGQDLFLCLTGF